MEVMIKKKIITQMKLENKIQIYNPKFKKILRSHKNKEYKVIIKKS